MICPICGKNFDDMEAKILENGNPVCPYCYEEIEKEEEDINESK